MKKLLLIDGNSMLFRAYYATVYGQAMTTSTGIPTNAIYGFSLMLSKAVKLIEPDYLLVAFDHDKQTYRYKEFPQYKGTRSETPQELKTQFPIAREFLDALHIRHFECSGLEADDIIGSLAKQSRQYEVSVLTSDKDLLQIVDDEISVWLMHKGITDIVKMDPQAVYDRFQLQPIQIIDMKGLAGDPSDNIPGVTKVGDKTAIKLLNEYQSVENLYDHIDEIKGKLKENLVNDREMAFLSKRLATIITDAKLDIDIESCAYQPEGLDAYQFYNKYEMRSLASRIDLSAARTVEAAVQKKPFVQRTFVRAEKLNEDQLTDMTVITADFENGLVAISNQETAVNMTLEEFLADKSVREFLQGEKVKIVYDIKKWHHLLEKHGLQISGKNIDLMIAGFLTDSKLKTMNDLFAAYNLPIESASEHQLDLFAGAGEDFSLIDQQNSRLAYLKDEIMDRLASYQMQQLYYDVELPLARVLCDMETAGFRCNSSKLDEIAEVTAQKMNYHENNVLQMAGHSFNLNSPKQLAEVLYDELKLARSTKRSTDAKALGKMADRHPIIEEILQYRKYAKLYSTYASGLKKYIQSDGKIHTVFNQCITETGRLSSSDPNLQNISIRNEEASLIRAAFEPEEGCVLVGADYSQVELRMLAHLADEQNLIDAFRQGYDIHTKTAMDIFGVKEEDVTAAMRRQAKAINFGIDYGMSTFGLAETLQIPFKLAESFINSYYEKYPKVREYMNNTVETCQNQGYVTTILNRRRDIPEINSSNNNLREFGKRAAMNAPVQGSAADLIKLAMLRVYEELNRRNLKSKIILQIHDELILNVPEQEREEVMELVEQQMENAMQLKVPLIAKATWGTNWLEVK